MGSSFLTTINVGLSLYSIILFLKSIVQFGLPNCPSRFLLYLTSFCASAFFTMKALTVLGYLAPFDFIRWQAFPLIAGGVALLLEVVSTLSYFSVLQQKVISRLPIMASALVFAFFPSHSDKLFWVCVLASVLFLSLSVRKARYQKRAFLKMVFFLGIYGLSVLMNQYWVYILGELFLFGSLFYFSIFQQAFGISGMIEKFQADNSGAEL